MVDKRNIGRDLARLEDRVPDADDGDRVAAYWEALADAIRDGESGDGDRDPADLPNPEAFFPVGYDRDDIMDAFDAEDASWADVAKRVAERRDRDGAPGNTDTEGAGGDGGG